MLPLALLSVIFVSQPLEVDAGLQIKANRSGALLRLSGNQSQASPMHYLPAGGSGCVKTTKLTGKVDIEAPYGKMDIRVCYAACSKKEFEYFGLTDGEKCWCASLYEGSELEADQCNIPCEGNKQQMCGGDGLASVYITFKCDVENSTAPEDTSKILHTYGSFKDESCGQAEDNEVPVDGSAKFAGSVDDCKKKCSMASGSQECHGFTFDSQLGQCTFHFDVVSGKVEKAEQFTCYFKNLA